LITNELGNLETLQKEYGEALDNFDKCINLAGISGNQMLVTKALINAARAAVQWKNFREIEKYLDPALEQIRKMNDSYFKALGLISWGQMARTVTSEFPESSDQWRYKAYQVFNEALNIAESFDNPRIKSHAISCLGKLYEDEKRIEEALYLTQRAIFEAQRASAPELLYQWQWQKGRLLKAKGDINGAIESYKQAVKDLQLIRQDLYTAYRESDISFRDKGGQIFMELADLLFKWSESQTNPSVVQKAFKDVRWIKFHNRWYFTLPNSRCKLVFYQSCRDYVWVQCPIGHTGFFSCRHS